MDKKNRFAVIASIATFLIITVYSIYKFVRFDHIDGASIIFGFVALSFVFNSLTWGDLVGNRNKDEMDQHVETQSSKIGYYALIVLSVLVLFISEGTGSISDLNNYPLIIVIGLMFVLQPLTAFIYSRKYR